MRFILQTIVLVCLALATIDAPAVAQNAAPAQSPAQVPAQQTAPAQKEAAPATAPATESATAPEPSRLTGVAAEQQAVLAGLISQVDEIDRRIVANSDNDLKLVDARLALETVLDETLASGVAFRPRLEQINNRLSELGPAPSGDAPPESERVVAERQALVAEKAEINVTLGNAEDLSVRVNGLITKISNLRRDLFTTLLTKRYELGDTISKQVVSDVAREGQTLRQRVIASFRYVYRFQFQALVTATGIALLVALAAHFIGRRLFGRLVTRDPTIEQPSYITRLSVAFWSVLLPTIALFLFLGIVAALFQSYALLNVDVRQFILTFFGVLFLGVIIHRLGYAVLSPDMPNWRLIKMESRPARMLIWLMTLLALMVGFEGLASLVSDRLGSPLSVTIVKSLLAAVISGFVIVAIARVRPFKDDQGAPRGWPTWFRIILYIVGVGSILAAIAGYISLAQFISAQIVVTGGILSTAYIGLAASRAISEEGGFAKTSVGRWLNTHNGMEDATLDQLGVLSSILINILIVLLFLPFILFMWGFQPGDIATWMRRAAGGFEIGTFAFSPFAILTGIFVFAIGYVITRWFQGWLDGTVMARGRVDVGVRNSIRAIAGYAGLALAALVAVSSAGLNLSNLALIAGGLSLGIGFGLQNVVSNFVSGLILLVERPFKAGDWVVAGEFSGTVKKISVRATEIETFQRQTVILPNSVLINGAVGNWTHRNRMGRVDIPVGVIHGSDVELVHRVLLENARSHPLVLKNPEPFVLFSGFTDLAMTFETRVFLADIGGGSGVQNDIRFGMVRAFAKEGITIAHTPGSSKSEASSEGWAKDDDHAEAKLMDRLLKQAEEDAAQKPRRRADPS